MQGKTSKRDARAERRASDLLSTSRRTLWPLIKLLVQQGVHYPPLAEALKEAYVLVALREFPLQQKRQTDSRISLMTGIQRRDVKRLREEAQARAARGVGPRQEAHDVGLANRVLALWCSDSEYLDRRRRPRPLAWRAAADGEPSFDALVRAVSTDIRPRALLDEWLRRGVVTLDAKNRVRLRREMLQAQRALEQPLLHLTRGIHDHLAAVVESLTADGSQSLDRYVMHGGLADESVAALATLARSQGLRALGAVEQRGKRLEARDARKQNAVRRVSFGVYLYSSERRTAADAASPTDAMQSAARKR